MAEVFISYAHGETAEAERVAAALRALGYGVWRDDQLPVHRAYSEVIEERLRTAHAVLVLWSKAAARSQWVRAEAEIGRERGALVQGSLDGALPPLPFNQIQCADLSDWTDDREPPGWGKVVASLAALAKGEPPEAATAPVPAARPAVRTAHVRPTVAVLPLEALGAGEAETRTFAEGLAEEITTALARFQRLGVTGPRGAAGRSDPRPPAAVAAELGVRFVLSGTVRRAGDRVRIALGLTDAREGRELWAERFDGLVAEGFDLQEETAAKVAAQVAAGISKAYAAAALARPPEALSAFELYLLATQMEREFTRASFAEAVAVLDVAVQREPNFSLGLAFGSLMQSLLLLNGWAEDPRATAAQALELARRALATGEEDPEALSVIATVFMWTGEDAHAADRLAERALKLNPAAPLAWFGSAWIKLFDGRPELAMAQFERHLTLDPSSPLYAFVTGAQGIALMLLGSPGEGAARIAESLRHVPEQRPFRVGYAAALGLAGRAAEAKSALAQVPPEAAANALALFRDETHRALIAEGLRRAAEG